MTDRDAISVFSLVLPDFSAMLSGTVEAMTPWLVIAILLLAVGTIWYAARQAHKALTYTRQTRRLIDGISPDQLYALRHAMRERAKESDPVVSDAWREFDETLVTDGQRLHNTVPAAEYFNEHRFAPRLIGNRLLHVIPTALTTLGLLGTFIGLTVGLRGLDLGTSGETLRTGIQQLVAGAALGFTASLWGVGMSLVVNLSERWIELTVVRRVEALQGDIDELFQMKSPEQSLSDIAVSSHESKEALQVLHEKIGSALQESVQHIGDSTSLAITKALESSMAPVMKEIAERAANQSADVFREVSEQLTSSFHRIGTTLAEELSASATTMRATLDYMGEQLAEHTDQHLARLSALEEVTSTHLGEVNDAITRQTKVLDESLMKVTAGLDRSALSVTTAAEQMESVTTQLAQASAELGTSTAALGQMLTDSITRMSELSASTSRAADTLAARQESLTALTTQSVEAARQLERASAVIGGGFDGMRAHQDAFLADLHRQLVAHSEAISAWLTGYADEVSAQTNHRMGEWNRQTESFTSTMLSAAQALSDVVDELENRSPVDVRAVPA